MYLHQHISPKLILDFTMGMTYLIDKFLKCISVLNYLTIYNIKLAKIKNKFSRLYTVRKKNTNRKIMSLPQRDTRVLLNTDFASLWNYIVAKKDTPLLK